MASPTGGTNAVEHRDAPHVVLVSIDGFRWDYPERFPTPNLHGMAERGVRAERMISVFPANTFPGHYSLATGLYPENHGVVGNRFDDPTRPDRYSLSDRDAVEDGSWYRGVPLWALAEMQGMVAASFYWVGSEANVGGVRPTHRRLFDPSVTEEERVDQVLSWLAEPAETRPRMITLYFELVDEAAHDHGLAAPEVRHAVERADAMIGRLWRGIERLPHGDRVYLIVVSDHGVAEWRREESVFFDPERYAGLEVIVSGSYASLRVDGPAERLPRLRDSLQAEVGDVVEVYLRSEVPERFHNRADPRVGDILLIPTRTLRVFPAGSSPTGGWGHGWDPLFDEMGAFFLMRGPGVQEGVTIPPFEAVHVYPLIAELLGLEVPEVDGRLDVLGRWVER